MTACRYCRKRLWFWQETKHNKHKTCAEKDRLKYVEELEMASVGGKKPRDISMTRETNGVAPGGGDWNCKGNAYGHHSENGSGFPGWETGEGGGTACGAGDDYFRGNDSSGSVYGFVLEGLKYGKC